MSWLQTLIRKWSNSSPLDGAIPADVGNLQKRIGYFFRDTDLLATALKHRSYVYAGNRDGIESNERLEFLGDAVLDLVVADFLFRRFPDRREGDLTQMKSLIVNRTVLSRKARQIDLGRYILLSQEEHNARGFEQRSILSDGFEALIGALYLDGGLEPSRRLIEQVVLHDFEDLIRREDSINFKSKLLEHTQSQGSGHPKYMVHAEEGPDHCKVFSVEVSVIGEKVGDGRGRSKKEAQQMAAKDALQRLGAL
ncbi:MAG: ribonuclease III [Candidatus Latescibacteria bacterium]|nr:ribonuclease III [Candidatus Latescibacterota bacterium]